MARHDEAFTRGSRCVNWRTERGRLARKCEPPVPCPANHRGRGRPPFIRRIARSMSRNWAASLDRSGGRRSPMRRTRVGIFLPVDGDLVDNDAANPVGCGQRRHLGGEPVASKRGDVFGGAAAWIWHLVIASSAHHQESADIGATSFGEEGQRLCGAGILHRGHHKSPSSPGPIGSPRRQVPVEQFPAVPGCRTPRNRPDDRGRRPSGRNRTARSEGRARACAPLLAQHGAGEQGLLGVERSPSGVVRKSAAVGGLPTFSNRVIDPDVRCR